MNQQIYTNPSMERSFVSNSLKTWEFKNYLNISISSDNTSKSILVFPGTEYSIIFYDANLGIRKSITGLILDVYCNQIKVKEKRSCNCSTCNNKDCCNSCNFSNSKNIGCIYCPPDTSSYEELKTYFIPINNIMGIDYVKNTNNSSNGSYIDEEEKFVLLGISATAVHAIIVHLDLFTDDHQDAVKSIDLKRDNVYDVVYEVDGITYEITGRVVEIKQLAGETESYVVRENTGLDNSVYTDATKFVLSRPTVKNIQIVFDTSDNFTGSYETINLSSIRDCTLMVDNNASDMVYTLDENTTYTVNNDVVSVTKDGNTTQIGIDELLNYYSTH